MVNPPDASKLERHVGYWLRFVSNHVSHAFMVKLDAKGVTVAEWVVMRQMFEGESTSSGQLAERLGMTRGAISKLIDRLCVKQLVERTAMDDDRRFQRITLTTKGKRLVPQMARLADENDREFFGHLTNQARHDLVQLLRDIVQRQGWKDLPVD